MDQDHAKILFDKGAIFLLLDFPCGSEFGIDYMSWTVGDKFKGVKMIPEGIHFIYFRFVKSDGQAGPRCGFFHNFSAKEIVVRKWDNKLEDMSPEVVSEEELRRFHENKKELDKFLGPYPYEKYKQWVSLTGHINKETINLLQPPCGYIYSVAQFESEGSTSESRKAHANTICNEENQGTPQKRKEADLLPDMKSVEGTCISYSDIPKKKYPDGASPAEITKCSMDSSYVLDLVLNQRFHNNSEKMLGEVQFAFICFLIGQHYDSFEQWKNLVHVLCTSGTAISKYPKTFLDFISVLHFQIQEIPSDFFVDIVTSNNFLTVTLHELFENILSDDSDIDEKLKKRALSFRKHLTEKFKWDFTSESDDCAPVIVDSC